MRNCRRLCAVFVCLFAAVVTSAAAPPVGVSPNPGERQLPDKMHSAMTDLPTIRVGGTDTNADIIGTDNRALQAAVDYVANLGGGVVVVAPGQYLMRDSLHLRSHVTVRGTPGKTILRKADGIASPLAMDGDYGEEQITVTDPAGFTVGGGVTVWDTHSGGFHTTVARITGRRGNTFSISRPLNDDYELSEKAQAATVFPVISGSEVEGVRLDGLTVDGNKAANVNLNGCRGAGIYFYRGFGAVIDNCTVHDFNGDGVSFQQSNDVTVFRCTSENNAGLGFHPGSGSQRPTLSDCTARGNGEDGLFLCWRVRHGVFENNLLEANGRYGISIGHKDTDNLLRRNTVRGNAEDGVFFRNESYPMAGHRNRLEENQIENNGAKAKDAAGIRVRGETAGLVLKNNQIRQSVGIRLDEKVGEVALEGNTVDAATPLDDRRGK